MTQIPFQSVSFTTTSATTVTAAFVSASLPSPPRRSEHKPMELGDVWRLRLSFWRCSPPIPSNSSLLRRNSTATNQLHTAVFLGAALTRPFHKDKGSAPHHRDTAIFVKT